MHTRRSATRAREHMPPLGGCMMGVRACVQAPRDDWRVGPAGRPGERARALGDPRFGGMAHHRLQICARTGCA